MILLNNLKNLCDKYDKIYLDCDDTLWASCEAIVQMLNKMYNKNFSGQDIVAWNFQCCFPQANESITEAMFDSIEFTRKVQFIKGAESFLSAYRNKIVIVTKGNLDNYINKRKWFEFRGYKDIPIIHIPLNQSKSLINMQNGLFIDDNVSNLLESNASFKLLFKEYLDDKDREWQRDWNGYYIYNWEL